MGNSLIKQAKKELKSQQYHWTVKSTMAFSTLVNEQIAGIQGEKYNIEYSLLQKEWKVYVLRRNNPKYLVTVYDLIQQKDSLCSNNREVSVVIEFIPYRLSDLGQLSFADGMYIIKCILEGYKILANNRIEFYVLDDSSICFNKEGTCKFWINENLYLSKPHANRIVSEASFISSLLEIIEMRIDCIKQEYFHMKQAYEVLNMQSMLKIVNQFYDSKIGCISSILSIGKYSTPPSIKNTISSRNIYKSINPERSSQQKMSISKYRQTNRRKMKEEQKLHEDMDDLHYRSHNEPKKLSLSFNKSRRNNEMEMRNAQERRQKQMVLMSPRKIDALSPFHIRLEEYSRQNTFIRGKRPFVFYQPIKR